MVPYTGIQGTQAVSSYGAQVFEQGGETVRRKALLGSFALSFAFCEDWAAATTEQRWACPAALS